jgi:hypothetical protein
VLIGSGKQDSVVVVNGGEATLIISKVASSDSTFAVVPSSMNVGPLDSAKFFITFAPSSPGAKSANIIFSHNAPGPPDSVLVTGNGTVDVTNRTESISAVYSLEQNYPNPFNPITTIGFTVPLSGFVSLRVYDLLGREVAVLVDGERPAGTSAAVWDAGERASGVYIYRLQAGSFSQTKRLVLLK